MGPESHDHPIIWCTIASSEESACSNSSPLLVGMLVAYQLNTASLFCAAAVPMMLAGILVTAPPV
jgi:hypothetical protein